ncbi:Cytochrome c oxidase subunit 7A [Didymosphaeria variabile]|uniref:Cytochrome c oxidase subunit 7A n=1 Tax=Didymosphaeria variabile TaxID=1932322 RepID=A0A9W8XYP3_9PLEO|nr:Cytochrome c oxidase subunit 7A [Didymosphaeria variabile]KAJ4361005.1 Cytochrome c oxidase subunit 7A [Didymosphaeria variabile]
MAVKPITGVCVAIERPRASHGPCDWKLTSAIQMLRRTIVLDLSVAMGLGVTAGYGWWYGYHVPAVRHRDAYYQKIEDERAAALGQK